MHLGDAEQQAVFQLRIPIFKDEASDEVLLLEPTPHLASVWDFDHKLIKKGGSESFSATRSVQQQVSCEVALLHVPFSQFPQPLFAQETEKYRRG
jgi:hypothetical protein